MRPGLQHERRSVSRERGCRLQRWRALVLMVVSSLCVSGCEGIQSTLDPAGRAAADIAQLFWWLVGGAVVVWLVVVLLTVLAIRHQAGDGDAQRTAYMIIGGGAVLPTVVLAVYLVSGLDMLPQLVEPAPEGSLSIVVSGEQWWWRVRYPDPSGATSGIELANEIRLPVGEPVQLFLDTPDVIHSFWIPSIGGKMDMIPGRVNRLTLEPTRTGIFRGVCAEYCGDSHALMGFYAVVMERPAFDAWLAQQAEPARAPVDPPTMQGAEQFVASGCGACHAVRGTEARGRIGPDLTHVGSRVSIGAATFLTDEDALFRWIAHTERVKPGVHMPSFGMLPDAEIRSIARYLTTLR